MRTLLIGAVLIGLVGLAWPADAQSRRPWYIYQQNSRVYVTSPGERAYFYAAERMNQTVGGGECTDLVDAALAFAEARPGANYVWGSIVPSGARILRGDVIQFQNAQFKSHDGFTWGTAPGGRHTAIVASADGTRVTLIHQNDGVRRVTQRSIDLAWSHTGSYAIYRPVRR